MTVRVFSRVPPEQVKHLHVDGESHTSVTLARVIWGERFGRRLALRRFEPWRLEECQAVLLIGDKVVTHQFEGFSHRMDLGEAWRVLTGLPFVFATWAARCEIDPGPLGDLLSAARDRGVASAADIARRDAAGRGWPVDLAVQYLTRNLDFTLTPSHRRGMDLFFELADKWRSSALAWELAPA